MVSKVTIRAELVDDVSRKIQAIDRNLQQTFGNIGRVATQFFGSIGRIATLATGVSAALAGRQAIIQAQEADRAERRLLQALEGRIDALERIKLLAGDIQITTPVEGTEVLEVAANLLAAGVAADQLDKALRATVDTAAALGVSTEEVATAIGQFSVNSAGLLSRRAPFLRQLQEDSKLATEGLDALIDRFGGAAAALATTPFGQAQVQTNRFNEALEKLGAVLIRLKVAAFEPLVDIAEQVAKVFDSGPVQLFLRVVESVPPVVQRVIGVVAALGVAFGVVAAAFGAAQTFGITAALAAAVPIFLKVVAVAVLVVGAFKAIEAAVSAFVSTFPRAVAAIEGFFAPVVALVGRVVGVFRGLFDLLSSGRVGFGDLFTAGVEQLKAFAVLVGSLIGGSIAALGETIADLFSTSAQRLRAFVVFAVDLVAVSVAALFDGISENASLLFDVLKEKIRSLFTGDDVRLDVSFAQLGQNIRAPLEEAVSGAFARLSESLNRIPALEITRPFAEAVEDAFASFGARVEAATSKLAGTINERTRLLSDQIQASIDEQDRLADDAFRTADEESARSRAQLQFQTVTVERIPLEDLVDPEELRKFLNTFTGEAREGVRELLLARLESEFDQSRIAIEDFFRARRELRLDEPVRAELAALANIEAIEQRRAEIGERFTAAVRERIDLERQLEVAEQNVAVADKLEGPFAEGAQVAAGERLLEIQLKIAEAAASASDALKDGKAIESERLAIAEDVVEARVQQAQELQKANEADRAALEEIQRQIDDAAQGLDQRLTAIGSQRDAGIIFTSEALEQQREAVEEFGGVLDGLRDKLEVLALEDLSPELEAFIDRLLVKIERVKANLDFDEPKTGFAAFSEGFQEGAGEIINRFGDMENAGRAFGEQAIGGLARSFSAFFLETEQGFKSLVGNILKGLADILLQAAFLQALGFAFAGFGGGGGGTGGVESIAGLANVGGFATSRGIERWNKGGFAGAVGRRLAQALVTPVAALAAVPAVAAAFLGGAARSIVSRALAVVDGADATRAAMANTPEASRTTLTDALDARNLTPLAPIVSVGRAAMRALPKLAAAAAILATIAPTPAVHAEPSLPAAERSVERPRTILDEVAGRVGRAAIAFVSGMHGATPVEAVEYRPQMREDGRLETPKEMARRVGRELARSKRQDVGPDLLPKVHRHQLVEDEAETKKSRRTSETRHRDTRDTSLHERTSTTTTLIEDQIERRARIAGAAVGRLGRGLQGFTRAAGAAGIQTLAVLGGLGILGTDDAPVERHWRGGISGAPLVKPREGFVPGQRGPNEDSVLAYLTIGEGIIQRPSVDYYSRAVIRAINDRLIPREVLLPYLRGIPDSIERKFAFAGGGIAPSAQRQARQGSGGTVFPVLVTNESNAERLFAGGPDAFLRMLEQVREAARGVLGIRQEIGR